MRVAPQDESRFDELRRYVRLDASDEALLRELLPHARPAFPKIAAGFYERIREHEGAHVVFHDEAQIERLTRSLVLWLERVCSGPRDAAYFEATSRIGRIHAKVGLPRHYLLAAMALIRVDLVRVADASMGDRADATRSAVMRALDVELAVILDAYLGSVVAPYERADALAERDGEEGRAAQARRNDHVADHAPILLVGLDLEGNVRLFNREAERVTGLSREEVVGRAFSEALLPPELSDEVGSIFAAAARGEMRAPDAIDTLNRTKSGKTRHVRWRVATVDGAGVTLVAAGTDTTEERELALRARRSEKLAAVGTLAAGLAHEIRNPLNGARLHLTFIERGLARAAAPDAAMIEAARVVRDEILRLGKLVDEFLEFAQPARRDFEPVAIAELCADAVAFAAPAALAAGVALATDLPPGGIKLVADREAIGQLLANLLTNAIEASEPRCGGHVTLRVRRHPRSVVVLEVEDDGLGLSSPEAPIFDAFFTTKVKGTGMGLAIAHRIVTDHEGSIEVTSRPGSTVFRVTLPLAAP